MKRALLESWGQFLSQFSWDWFLTLTFRDLVKSFRAHRLFDRFVRDLAEAAGIPIFWFRADEIGPQGGRFHLHALIGNVGHLRRMTWVDRWAELAGYGRILPFRSERGAAYYCAKYVAKKRGEWEMSDNLAAFSQYQPVLPLQGLAKQKLESSPIPQKWPEREPRNSDRRYQYRFPYGLSGKVLRPSMISEVYRAEVTRGRGRFREFFPPSGRAGR